MPVGIFLSAGLDSSTLVALASEIKDTQICTVTLGFKEYVGTDHDETILTQTVDDQYHTLHSTQWVSQANFAAEYQNLLHVMDQPSVDGINTYFVCKTAKEAGLKVTLSGIGGDELFGGYPSFTQIPKMDMALSANQPLPHQVLNKPKSGFSIPVNEWLRNNNIAKTERGLRHWAHTLINN